MASAKVAPLHALDEAAALDWLRAQPGSSVTLTAAELGRRWGRHRQWVGRRLAAWAKSGLVTLRGNEVTALDAPPEMTAPAVTPGSTPPAPPADAGPTRETNAVPQPVPFVTPAYQPVQLPGTPAAGVDVAAYTAAIALAGVAAVFSIRGMVTLFPGSPQSVVAMAATMEAAKLVTAAWLAARWSVTPWIARLTLMAFVSGIAAINGVGVFSQLVSAHVGERGAAVAAVETRDAALVAQLEVAASRVGDLDRRLGQIDTAIETAAKSGKTNTALSAIEGQRRARAALAGERKQAAGALAALKTERAGVAAQGRVAETEAAPIVYVAEMLGVGTDSERAIRWLVLMMVLCCDPLAIVLTAAASAQRGRAG
jgi:hypothetical protein